MDPIAWFIATMHDMFGHDKAAMVLGQPPGDKADCILCKHDRGEATREEVIAALAPQST